MVSASFYGPDAEPAWDELVAVAPMATFLHTRRFLGYHGERFVDRSLMLYDARSKLVAVLPAAVDPSDERRVVSHPGITYGGIVHRGDLLGPAAVDAVGVVRDCYAAARYRSLLYKAVPHIYHRVPSADDVFAVLQLGGRLVRCGLSCAIDLRARGRRSERRRRGERKARGLGVEVGVEAEHLGDFWPVLQENLALQHHARPTHTFEELQLLLDLFPNNIEVVTGWLDGSAVAGVVLFKTEGVVHAQYIAANASGRDSAALDLVIEYCISRAISDGARYFDLGTSMEADGALNAGLYKFKSEFGGGGMLHQFFELDLQR